MDRFQRCQGFSSSYTQHLICVKSGEYDVQFMGSLTLEINGESRTVPPVSNLRDLLRYLEVGESRIAVEVNRRIIRRPEWESTPIGDGERVEIVQFVGGG